MSDGITHWYCDCGEVMHGRKARDHECEALAYARARMKTDEPLEMTQHNDEVANGTDNV